MEEELKTLQVFVVIVVSKSLSKSYYFVSSRDNKNGGLDVVVAQRTKSIISHNNLRARKQHTIKCHPSVEKRGEQETSVKVIQRWEVKDNEEGKHNFLI